jgi:F-type H+-transporting ATPase subunit delta
MSKDRIAYPYAKAAFEYAKEHSTLTDWKAFLEKLAFFFQVPEVLEYLTRPSVLRSNPLNLWDIFLEIKPEIKKDSAYLAYQNFFKILIESDRLGVVQYIHEVFNELCLDEAQLISALVISANSLSQAQKNQIQTALKIKFTHDVDLVCQEDPALMAGLRIKVGDWVFDNSLQGRFERLKSAINS